MKEIIAGLVVIALALVTILAIYNDGYNAGRCDALGGKVIDGRCYKNIEEMK